MARTHKWWLALTMGSILAVICLRWPVATVIAAPSLSGRLELVAGVVHVVRDGKRVVTASGMPLAKHAEISTDKGARALLSLVGGGSAFLAEATTLVFVGEGVSLTSGRVWLDVPTLSRPIVHQLGAVSVAVSNAGLSVERHGDRVEVYVARGLAVVSARNDRREVAAGERAVISESGELRIEPVSFWENWTGGMADRGVQGSLDGTGSGRLYAVDRLAQAGTPARPLEIKRQAVHARIADGIAETEVDQTFWNPSDRPVEGYYWFTIPEHALVTGFALETNNVLIEGEVVERKEAALKYEAAVERSNDPALLEWIDGRSYRARIFPVPAVGTRRVVLRYVEPVTLADGRMRWVYPMSHGDSNAPSIDEFSLALDLGDLGKHAKLATLPDARIEHDGQLITMRRSVYTPHADFQVELEPNEPMPALRATRFQAGADQADFVMLRWLPDLDFRAQKALGTDLVLAVDASAGGDDADRQLRFAVAEAALRNLAAGDHFAVMTTDVAPRVIYPDTGLAPADEAHVAQALERLSSCVAGGATDLGAMFDPGLSRLHAAEQPALVYIGDGQATSGELNGAELVEHLRRSLEGARARFFTVGVGADANHPLLERLAAVGGGQHFRIDSDELAVREALQLTAAIKTPTITDLKLDVGVGLDEPLSSASGKLAYGQELTLLARTHHDLPKKALITGRLNGAVFSREYELVPRSGAATPLVPRLWAAELARRVLGRSASAEQARGKIVSLALEYGLVTPFSSLLALDSEAAYQQLSIPRAHRPWDRLREEQASAEPHTCMGDVLAFALAPITLLSGCDAEEPRKAALRQELGPNAPTPIAPSAAQADRPYQLKDEPAAQGEAAASAPATLESMRAAVAERRAGSAGVRHSSADIGNATDNAYPGDDALSALGTLGALDKETLRAGTLGVLRAYAAKRTRSAFAQNEDKPAPRTARVDAYIAARVCSDAAARPFADRAVLWQRRMHSASTMQDALALYDAARAACEVSGQHDQRTLLGMVEPFARRADEAELMFGHFAHDPEAVRFLARHLLRHTLDPYIAALARRAVQGDSLDWARTDLELAALPSDNARVERLRALLLSSPHDVDAELRLMKFLIRSGKRAEALSLSARLREQGLLSPLLLRDLGDIQMEAGLPDDALRTYTEIVEFDPHSAGARRLVGDTLLANHWYDAAYRQYRTLAELTAADASSQIRLALAASGSGRSDEALRILRRVAERADDDSASGNDDPRLHARLLASAMVARLLAVSPAESARAKDLTRELKQLQVLKAPGRLCVLTWDSLDSTLGLGSAAGETIDGKAAGVVALAGSEQSMSALAALVTLRSEHGAARPIHWQLHELVFDGKTYQVKVLDGQAG